MNEVNLLIKHNALDKNDLDEEILEQLDIVWSTISEIEESREEETFRNWVCEKEKPALPKPVFGSIGLFGSSVPVFRRTVFRIGSRR